MKGIFKLFNPWTLVEFVLPLIPELIQDQAKKAQYMTILTKVADEINQAYGRK